MATSLDKKDDHAISHSYLKFYGTRGSLPVSGPAFIRYGGNTVCLEVRNGEDLLIIDAGSGIFPLGNQLSNSSLNNLNLLISHWHWDHLMGLPFFAPLYQSKTHITLWSPKELEKSAKELLGEVFADPFFPVQLEEISSRITFKEISPGQRINIGNIQVEAFPTHHSSSSLCFKLSLSNKTIVYATDNEVFKGFQGHPNDLIKTDDALQPYLDFIHFLEGCNLVIHEAQYFAHEYANKVGWGHSSIPAAIGLMKLCKAPEWIVTHHDPSHTDAKLDEKLFIHRLLLQECNVPCHVDFAYDGFILPL